MTIRRPPPPGAWNSTDPKTRDDLRRMRVWLEQLARDVDALTGGGTITEVTSGDASVTVTNGTGPVVDLSVTGGGGAVDGVTGSGAIDVSPTTGSVVVSLDESELENGGAQEISIAGLNGQAADGQRASALVTAGSDVDVSAASAPTAGQALTATDATHATWQTPAVYDPARFWVKAPASPHTDDDEFTSSSINGRWTVVKHGTWTSASSSGPVDGTGVGAGTNFKMTPDYRGSFLAWQGNDGGIIRNFILGTTTQVRFRIDPGATADSSGVGNYSFVNLYFGEYVAGAPDLTNNYARWGFTNGAAAASINWLLTGRQAGGGGWDVTGPNEWGHPRDMEFILVIEAGATNTTAYYYLRHGAALEEVGAHIVGGSGNFGISRSAYIYLRFAGRWGLKGSGNYNNIQTCDYIRMRDDHDLEAY